LSVIASVLLFTRSMYDRRQKQCPNRSSKHSRRARQNRPVSNISRTRNPKVGFRTDAKFSKAHFSCGTIAMEVSMAMVMIRCPKTGQDVPTGIDTDSRTFSGLPTALARAHCPHCGRDHTWNKDAAWLAGDCSADADDNLTIGSRGRKTNGATAAPRVS
jgi:hypothetical protein